MEMINIINENKTRKQESIKEIQRQRQIKKEKLSYIKMFIGYLIATYVFVQIVTLLVK